MKRFTVYLEEDQLEALEEMAQEFSRDYGQSWTKGAVIRLALSEFLSRQGKMA